MSKIRLSLGLVVGFIAVSANAATIIEASGANDATLGTSSLANYNAIAFSTTSDFTNVNISTTFISFGGDAVWDVNAFLTTLLGPGTTAAGNEIASLSSQLTITDSPVTIPYTLTPQNLFSIPFLAAGATICRSMEPLFLAEPPTRSFRRREVYPS